MQGHMRKLEVGIMANFVIDKTNISAALKLQNWQAHRLHHRHFSRPSSCSGVTGVIGAKSGIKENRVESFVQIQPT